MSDLVDVETLTEPPSADEVRQLTVLLADLVAHGAALGWVHPPGQEEVAALFARLAAESRSGDACVAVARSGGTIVAVAYWRRYERPTHRPHVDIEKVAVARSLHGRGIGRSLMASLIASARAAGVEVVTLDLRGDNAGAIALYESLGFTRYGRLPAFVAVGDRRYDKLFYALDLRDQLQSAMANSRKTL